MDWFLFYEYWENKLVEKKIYGLYVLFVWYWLYMYIELIWRNYVDDIGVNVIDKFYYLEIIVYNLKKNGGGCYILI